MYLSEGGGLGSYQTTWLCNNNVGISVVVLLVKFMDC